MPRAFFCALSAIPPDVIRHPSECGGTDSFTGIAEMKEPSFSESPSLEPKAEEFLSRLIRKKSRQIICQAGFRPCDQSDIEQELRLKVEQHLSAFRGDRGHLYAFLTAVVERRAANLVRDGGVKKRDSRGMVSLSVRVDVNGDGPVELAAVIGQREADARLKVKTRPAQDANDLKFDVEDTMAQLTPDERRVGEGLKHGTVAGVSRELGIPRSTIYDMLARWRDTFEQAGLRKYL
jgi:DNA-directed RNA polymerase specialized sigma24 family protein